MSDSDLFSESDNDDIPPDTSYNKKLIKKEVQINCFESLANKKPTCICKRTHAPRFLRILQESYAILTDKKKPYIFYTLKEISSFTQTSAPITNKIRTIGIYTENNIQLQYLTDVCNTKDRRTKIPVDFRLTKKMPIISQQIQVFGNIDFKQLENFNTYVPVLIVQFWNCIDGDVGEFISRLQLLQRSLAVRGCTSVNFESTVNIDRSFDEINDTIFNKAADGAEALCKAVNECLNMSEDLFE